MPGAGFCGFGRLYSKEAARTRPEPARKVEPGERSSKSSQDTRPDTMMDTEVAKPFRMLSAYLMVAATTNPPKACRQITATTEKV